MEHPDEYIAPLDFRAFLDGEKGERGISDFLRGRPEVLYWTLCRAGGHSRFVFREFPLGSSYVADFAVLNSYSGVWEVKFVELEPVDDRFFTRAGVPARRLAGAIKQVDDWAQYFEANKPQVRADLVRWAKNRDLLKYSDGDHPSNFSGHCLADPQTNLFESFHIFIGRRHEATPDDQGRKGRLSRRHSVDVASYDRLLDLANDRYANAAYWQSGLRKL